MSLRCSVFGHRYGDSEVRRDREQDGSELVETVQELKVCERCGKDLIVSEKTEVTTVETGDGVEEQATDAGGVDAAGSGASATDRSGGTPRSAGTTGGTPRSAGTTGPPGGGSGSPSDEAGGAGPDETGRTVDDTPAGSAGAAGGSRGGDTGATGEQSGGPAHDSPEQEMPPTRKDDAVIIDEDGHERPAADWPQNEEGDDGLEGDWQPDIELDTDSDTDGRPKPRSTTSGGLTVPEGEFHCSDCDFSTTVESSSLREGDFCPECHRGSLEHHIE